MIEHGFRSRAEYSVAHDALPQLFDDVLAEIDRLMTHKESPLLRRYFRYDSESSYAEAETEYPAEGGDAIANSTITEQLHIHKIEFKPPNTYRAVYYVRTVIDFNNERVQPIISEYCIENLCNGAYFGTLRRYFFDESIDATEQGRSADGIAQENMTVYDAKELVNLLGAHCDEIDKDSDFVQLIKEYG